MKLITLGIFFFIASFSSAFSFEFTLPPKEGSVNWQADGTYVVEEKNRASILETLTMVHRAFGNEIEEAGTEEAQIYMTLLCKQNFHEDSEFLAFVMVPGRSLPAHRICYLHVFSQRSAASSACQFLGMKLSWYNLEKWKFACKPKVPETLL